MQVNSTLSPVVALQNVASQMYRVSADYLHQLSA